MNTSAFQAGGTLREGAIYVRRPADDALLEGLRAGEFRYVLAPRQVGKSSLRRRTAAALKAEGVRCVSIDITEIGSSDVQAEVWYRTIAYTIAAGLDLEADPEAFVGEHFDGDASRTPVQRWSAFLAATMSAVEGPVVIFLDEIDSVLALPFKGDDFFASIRAVYNARGEVPGFDRLTFCLLGVAAPSDLIQDRTRTPFNVGGGVWLEDFTDDQAKALLPGLQEISRAPQQRLHEIMRWTAGHPYMTQRLCQELALIPSEADVPGRVNALVEALFLRRGRIEDQNLAYAEAWFQRGGDDDQIARMLELYRRLLSGEEIEADGDDPVQLRLRLTGMAAERSVHDWRRLQPRNRIFASVFDAAWVQRAEADRLLAAPLRRWLKSDEDAVNLLQGEAFDEAMAWVTSGGKPTEEETRFLLASAAGVRREEKTLKTVVLPQTQQALEEAQTYQTVTLDTTEAIKREAQRARRTSRTMMLAFVVAAIAAGIALGQQFQKIEGLQGTREELELRVAKDRTRINLLKDEVTALTEELNKASAMAQGLEAQLENTRNKLKQTETAAKNAKEKVSASEAALKEADEKQKAYEKALQDEIAGRIQAEEREAAEAEARKAETTARETFEDALNAERLARLAADEALQAQTDLLASLRDRGRETQKRLEFLETVQKKLATKDQALSQLQSKYDGEKKRAADLERKYKEAQARADELKTSLEKYLRSPKPGAPQRINPQEKHPNGSGP